jgi:exopolysaccharide biosynthesis polyprenyl glycosylphosphotransferase
MITNRSRGLFTLHSVAQSQLALLLFWLLVLLLGPGLGLMAFARLDRYILYSVVLSAAVAVYSARVERKKKSLLHIGTVGSLRMAFRQALVALMALLLFLFATKDAAISRIFLASYIPLLWLCLAVSNRLLPRILAGFFFRGARSEGALFLGPPAKAARLLAWLCDRNEFGIRALGLLTDDPKPEVFPGLPILGKIGDLERVMEKTGARSVVLVELPENARQIRPVEELCENKGVRFIVVNDIEERFGHSVSIDEEDGLQFVSLRPEPLESPLSRLLKRLLDLAIALPVIILLLPPVAVLAWAAQRIQSPGPLFYKQRRAGLQGCEFAIYKFRTMHTGNDDETRQAAPDDARVFSAGRFLRVSSLDELPQFWNVLRGEMSIVGPRPHLREHDERFASSARDYRIRNLIKPGITGLAQVRGFRGIVSDPSDIVSRVELDLHYLENWSPLLDIVIILRTAWCVLLPPKTAH